MKAEVQVVVLNNEDVVTTSGCVKIFPTDVLGS